MQVSRLRLMASALMALTVWTLLASITAVAAQTPVSEERRINRNNYMGGLAIYCVDANRQVADNYQNGGGLQIVDEAGIEWVYVSEADINAAFEQVRATGQYATLATSVEPWFGQNIGVYLLPGSEEFQVNANDDHGKLVEFTWEGCKRIEPTTNDGCLPGWDIHPVYGYCVFDNFD